MQPFERPQTINDPSDEIVTQSISQGNARILASTLRSVIKSFSNKCNVLSMATTTFSLRKVASNFGSRSIYLICSEINQINSTFQTKPFNGKQQWRAISFRKQNILTAVGSLLSIRTKVSTENVSLKTSSSDKTLI